MMNKWVKGFFITAISCMALGLVVTITAVAAGGRNEVWERVKDGKLNITYMNEWEEDYDDFHDEIYEADWEDEVFDVDEKEWPVSSENAADIRKLDIELKGGKVEIVLTDSGEITITQSVSEDSEIAVRTYVKDKTFVIDEKKDTTRISKYNNRTVTVYIPKDLVLHEIEIKAGGAALKAEKLQAQEVELEIGAGAAVIHELIADKMDISIGAGQLNVLNGTVVDADIESAVGYTFYEGIISGGLSAECATGAIEFVLHDSQENHNYAIEAAVGNVTIGDESFSGIASGRHINNKALSTYEIECGIGSISLEFE